MAKQTLYYNTVSDLLLEVLTILMNEPLFDPFRLVGGTNLSLKLGHRKSVDIDLFTDADYGSLDFKQFEAFLENRFQYFYKTDTTSIVGFGRSYYIGDSKDNYIKVDLMYTDKYINEAETIDNIRMASLADIAAMKINAISRCGRKKDFWDVHILLDIYSIKEMLEFHKHRHEWEHDEAKLLDSLVDFSEANEMEDPICLMGKNWTDIKLTFIEIVDSWN